jgi:Ca2+/Na+ antiporter
MSFLVSVNIFILSSITLSQKKFYLKQIFLESSVIFGISLLLIFFSIYKRTDLNNIDDMKDNRITKQLSFNLSIYYCLFIIINYLLYLSKDKQKYWKNLF